MIAALCAVRLVVNGDKADDFSCAIAHQHGQAWLALLLISSFLFS